ncbi:MAG TPA: hypothetical protein VEU30_09660, partial [Thermoanaerobaculia bacterium]|nr:hypothetical protein [Thermoanaerobaculia bacterium]
VFAPFRFVLPPGDPKKAFAQAREHFQKASARIGFTLPIPEQTTNVIGYRLLQAGHVKEAIEVFRANVESFPQSANVYDSLGEAQEAAGAFQEALASYRRAAELGKTNGDPNVAVFERNAERVSKK